MRLGFSLIELMVVVAIVAILSAVAMPAYKQYKLKAMLQDLLTYLERVAQDLKDEYARTGAFPNSITVNGQNIPNVCWQSIGSGLANIYSFSYNKQTNPTNYVLLGVSLSGLEGIPGYSTPTGPVPNGTKHNAYFYAIVDFNGIIRTGCGQLTVASTSNWIPLDYLPAGCQCTDLANFATNGTCTP